MIISRLLSASRGLLRDCENRWIVCSTNIPPVQVPPTPSQFRSWVTLHLMSIVTMTTLTLHLWLVEVTIAPQFNLDYFSGLMLKYFFGNFEILLIPVIALTVDKKIRDGLFVILTAKKKGILSKTNSVYSEYM